MDKQQLAQEKLKEIFQELAQENRDHGHIPPRRVKCNDCQHRILGTAKCSLLYPNGIPNEILDKENCEKFLLKERAQES